MLMPGVWQFASRGQSLCESTRNRGKILEYDGLGFLGFFFGGVFVLVFVGFLFGGLGGFFWEGSWCIQVPHWQTGSSSQGGLNDY